MLVIRMQRIGRKGHAQFRVVVQDSRRTPSSGRVVALLGSYNPHTKEVVINKEKAQTYLDNGAQPTDRVVALLLAEGITLPKWVQTRSQKTRPAKKADKLRKNQPTPVAEEKPTTASETDAESTAESQDEATETSVAEESQSAEPATTEEPTEA